VPAMSANNRSLVEDAIRNRHPIQAMYHGLERWMCPHVLGYKGDELHCLFYQFDGDSERGLSYDGSPSNWRCMPVDDLQEVDVLDGDWHTASSYSAYTQHCIDDVILEA
jgi:hypothetical protein